MKRNHLAAFAVSAAALGILALLAWYLLEIRPVTIYDPPSREVRMNDYAALDRWLAGMGIPVRTEKAGDVSAISQAREKNIFIQASLFEWTDAAAAYLVNWVEEGGSLFLALDYDGPANDDFLPEEWDWNTENPASLLEEFGIKLLISEPKQYYRNAPSYDYNISFEMFRDKEALLLKNRDGEIKLAQIKRGKGKVTVTGRPLFLQNSFIKYTPNTKLAWTFFASGSDTPGWFFVRGVTRAGGLPGGLFRHGNLTALLVSALVLIAAGFWAALPMFGLVRPDDEKPGKPLRERFLAEGRFLKKYGALNVYTNAYLREIRRRLARNEGISDAGEIERRVLEIWGSADGPLLRVMRNGKAGEREFPKLIVILKTILERL